LIYSHNAPGNYARISNLLTKRIPIPLLGLKAERSFLSISNLNHFLHNLMSVTSFRSGVYLLADKEITTTADFLSIIRTYHPNSKAYLFYLPEPIIKYICYFIGFGSTFEKLASKLAIDISHTEDEFNWIPPYTIEESFRYNFFLNRI